MYKQFLETQKVTGHLGDKMETDGTTTKPKSSSSAAGSATSVAQTGLQVTLHPLVIMNISDHWTRMKVQSGSPGSVYGALLGQQHGRQVELWNSFELKYEVDSASNEVRIDRAYCETKEAQLKQVFPQLDLVGWYAAVPGDAGKPSDSDRLIHRQLCAIVENPLFLKLNPLSRQTDLPINVFESAIELPSTTTTSSSSGNVKPAITSKAASTSSSKNTAALGAVSSQTELGGEVHIMFTECVFTLATEQSERIGVDHVARVAVGFGSTSQSSASQGAQAGTSGGMAAAPAADQHSVLTDYLLTQYNAIKMLSRRVELVSEYVRAVQNGQLPVRHAILRQIAGLCNRLPLALEDSKLDAQFRIHCEDISLMAYLAALTKTCNVTNSYMNKFLVLYDRKGRRGLSGRSRMAFYS